MARRAALIGDESGADDHEIAARRELARMTPVEGLDVLDCVDGI